MERVASSALSATLSTGFIAGKFVPQLLNAGFQVPDSGLYQDSETGRWCTSDIDWEPLKATMRNGGPDSKRRLSDAKAAWEDASWVRDALDEAVISK